MVDNALMQDTNSKFAALEAAHNKVRIEKREGVLDLDTVTIVDRWVVWSGPKDGDQNS
jgi:hypothetical protein